MGSDRSITDIVMTSRNRLSYLKETVTHLLTRTHSSYALHVLDDNSEPEVTDYLLKLWQGGYITSLYLSNEHRGLMANKNLATWVSFSDPFVLVDDDILCPDIEPDWLTRSLEMLAAHPEVGIMALNHPGAYRGTYERQADISYCEAVGNTFMFVRRQIVTGWHHAHYRGNFGWIDEIQRCGRAKEMGYKVAFINGVYCYHIGRKSAATGGEYGGPFIEPLSWETLEPPEAHR